MPVSGSVACRTDAAAKLAEDSRSPATAGKVMTFETTGTRGVCARVRSGRPRRTQAIPRAADVVGDIQSPHTGNVSSGVPHGEVMKIKSSIARARVSRVDIYSGPMRGAIRLVCETLFPAEKCLVPTSGQYACISACEQMCHVGAVTDRNSGRHRENFG